jgi:GNAT superfamily N-acetyltransferase
MPQVEIRRVLTKGDRRAFVECARRCNAGDPCWVPPLVGDTMEFLDPARGVFFEHGEAALFMAWRGEEPAGRISAQVNVLHDERHGPGTGFVGFFECENDPATAGALFAAAADWLRARDRTTALGPLSFGIYDEIGVLVDGFDTPPFVLTPHNPAWYARLFEENGWRKAVDWYSFRGRRGMSDAGVDPRYGRFAERVLKRPGLTVRNLDPKGNLERDVKIVQSVFNAAWDENWGHVPITDREFERLKKAVLTMLIPELSPLIEIDGRPVAFALALRDANVGVKAADGRLFPFGWITLLSRMRRTDRFRIVLMGVLEGFRGQGLEAALYHQVIGEGIRLGFHEIEMSQIVETNAAMLASIERLPVERSKTWRIYEKDLTP